MPELRDGKVVYSDVELADIQKNNESTQAAREAQARLDAADANVGAMQRLVMRAPEMEPAALAAQAERAAAEKALADAQPTSGDA